MGDARSLPKALPEDEYLAPHDETQPSKNIEAAVERAWRQQHSGISTFHEQRHPGAPDATRKKLLTSTDFTGSPKAMQPERQPIHSGAAQRGAYAHIAVLYDRSSGVEDDGSEQATQSAEKHEDKAHDLSRTFQCPSCFVDITVTRCSTFDLSCPECSPPLLERGKSLPSDVRADACSKDRRPHATAHNVIPELVTPEQSTSFCDKANATNSREQDYHRQLKGFYQDRLELPKTSLQQRQIAASGQSANHDSSCTQGLIDEKTNQDSPWRTVLDLEDEETDG
ncbi:hypothetical protein Esti_005531 [Eimeria stiedai]